MVMLLAGPFALRNSHLPLVIFLVLLFLAGGRAAIAQIVWQIVWAFSNARSRKLHHAASLGSHPISYSSTSTLNTSTCWTRLSLTIS
jgi:hypothetical protein